MKFPLSIQSKRVIVDADLELICETEGATPDELYILVRMANDCAAQRGMNGFCIRSIDDYGKVILQASA